MRIISKCDLLALIVILQRQSPDSEGEMDVVQNIFIASLYYNMYIHLCIRMCVCGLSSVINTINSATARQLSTEGAMLISSALEVAK